MICGMIKAHSAMESYEIDATSSVKLAVLLAHLLALLTASPVLFVWL